MSDPLQDAVRALRETSSGEASALGQYTRSRVLSAVRLQKRRRVQNVAFGIPLAAILLGTGAWAANQTLPLFVQRVSVAIGLREPPSIPATPKPLKSVPRATSKAAAARSAETLESDASVGLLSEAVDEVPASADETELGREYPSDAVQGSKSASEAPARMRASSLPRDTQVTERELSLYEVAHRAHFVDKNAQSALGAWDEYLRNSPRGRFLVEATYNRALCLVRLGRHSEARKALEPFAGGRMGGYRKAEAQALIEQLSRDVP